MPASAPMQRLTISLPTEVIEIIRAKVASGEYPTEDAVIEAAINETLGLPKHDEELEQWIATEGLRRFDAMKADPSRGLSSEEVFASLGDEPDELSKAG